MAKKKSSWPKFATPDWCGEEGQLFATAEEAALETADDESLTRGSEFYVAEVSRLRKFIVGGVTEVK